MSPVPKPTTHPLPARLGPIPGIERCQGLISAVHRLIEVEPAPDGRTESHVVRTAIAEAMRGWRAAKA